MTFGTGGSTFDLRLLGQLVRLDGACQTPGNPLNIYWYACCLSFGSGIWNGLWATTTTLAFFFSRSTSVHLLLLRALGQEFLERPSLGQTTTTLGIPSSSSQSTFVHLLLL
jgi:hypothetical protein